MEAQGPVLTGWCLLALFLGLCAFNARKRLSMLPLGSASLWLRLHAGGGLLAAALFWLHARSLWPLGLYERLLALLFYLVTFNGLAGYALQRVYPRLLAATGVELIFERIPEEVARLREKAEALLRACTAETGSDTLARHYLEQLDWFFRRPRFVLSHACAGEAARHWVRRECGAVSRYLNETERGYLERLTRLADRKVDVDFHYAAQGIMKLWLLIHLPLAAALMVLTAWHILLVHAYAL